MQSPRKRTLRCQKDAEKHKDGILYSRSNGETRKIRKLLHTLYLGREKSWKEGRNAQADTERRSPTVDLHLGPMTATSKLFHKHLFVVVDGFSKFV